jgi:hypothetical protein
MTYLEIFTLNELGRKFCLYTIVNVVVTVLHVAYIMFTFMCGCVCVRARAYCTGELL